MCAVCCVFIVCALYISNIKTVRTTTTVCTYIWLLPTKKPAVGYFTCEPSIFVTEQCVVIVVGIAFVRVAAAAARLLSLLLLFKYMRAQIAYINKWKRCEGDPFPNRSMFMLMCVLCRYGHQNRSMRLYACVCVKIPLKSTLKATAAAAAHNCRTNGK